VKNKLRTHQTKKILRLRSQSSLELIFLSALFATVKELPVLLCFLQIFKYLSSDHSANVIHRFGTRRRYIKLRPPPRPPLHCYPDHSLRKPLVGGIFACRLPSQNRTYRTLAPHMYSMMYPLLALLPALGVCLPRLRRHPLLAVVYQRTP
jgi:hypothetical protein